MMLCIVFCIVLLLCSNNGNSISNDTLAITSIVESNSVKVSNTDINERKKLDPYCNRPWPDLELVLPVCLTRGRDMRRHYEVETLFLRSFLLFWPLKLSNTSLNSIVDAEVVGNAQYNEYLGTLDGIKAKIPGGVKVSHGPYYSWFRKGHDRNQHSMFWADNFTTSEYVGFVDTDCVFVTYIDREDLFEEGKPVINGRSGKHDPHDFWDIMPNGTYYATGILEPMRCMSYFPAIIKRSHLKDIRDHISQHHNKSFDEAFYDISGQPYSQFGIFCAYLYKYKRDEYKWYVHTETPDWNGKDPPPSVGQDGDLSIFQPEMYLPKPRIATHARYREVKRGEPHIAKYIEQLNIVFQRGVCISPPFPKQEEICKEDPTNTQGFYEEMHRFEFFWWDKLQKPADLKSEFDKRYLSFSILQNLPYTFF